MCSVGLQSPIQPFGLARVMVHADVGAEHSSSMGVPASLCGVVLQQQQLSVSAWLLWASAFGGEKHHMLLLV